MGAIDPTFSGEIPGGATNIANRPDDAEDYQLATPVGWNSIIQGNIEEVRDSDWFVLESRGPNQDGFFTLDLQRGHPGVSINGATPNIANSAGGIMVGRGPDGIFPFGADILNQQSFNNSDSARRVVDLRNFPGEDYKYYFQVQGNAFRTGPYTIILENPIIRQAEQLDEALENFGQVTSVVNDFGILASFTYLASTFEYINQYGQMETHNPEEFFTRLFLSLIHI